MSADRIAAQLARQPGLGSAGPAAMPASAPQAAPAIVTLLPGICADIHLGVELPRRFCGDWDGLDAAPAWFREALVREAAAAPTIRRSCIVNAPSAVSRHGPIRWASAARLWRRTRLAGGLALGLAAATLLLNWLTVTRLVARLGGSCTGWKTSIWPASARRCQALPPPSSTGLPGPATPSPTGLPTLRRARGPDAALVTVQEEERQALARDLHDAFGQCLAAAGARAAAIELAAPPERDDLREDAQGIEAIIATMRESLRGALARLELPDLAEAGLEEALRGLVADWRGQTQVRAGLHLDVRGDLSDIFRERGGEPLSDRAGTADETPCDMANRAGSSCGSAGRRPDHER